MTQRRVVAHHDGSGGGVVLQGVDRDVFPVNCYALEIHLVADALFDFNIFERRYRAFFLDFYSAFRVPHGDIFNGDFAARDNAYSCRRADPVGIVDKAVGDLHNVEIVPAVDSPAAVRFMEIHVAAFEGGRAARFQAAFGIIGVVNLDHTVAAGPAVFDLHLAPIHNPAEIGVLKCAAVDFRVAVIRQQAGSGAVENRLSLYREFAALLDADEDISAVFIRSAVYLRLAVLSDAQGAPADVRYNRVFR